MNTTPNHPSPNYRIAPYTPVGEDVRDARARRITINADGDFTPAGALEFALKVIDTAREEGVRFVDPTGVR